MAAAGLGSKGLRGLGTSRIGFEPMPSPFDLTTCRLPLQGQKLFSEFAAILKSNNATMSLTNKSEWWSQRLALNEKLKVTALLLP